MYIRFVILLMTIFMVFVPCYGMQVSHNHETLVVTSKVEAKVYKALKVKNNDIVSGIFLVAIGLGMILNAIFTKRNKNKIWGTVLIVFGIAALIYAMGFALAWLVIGTYSTQQASGLLLVLAAFLGVGSIISLFFGDKLLRKGRKEEKEKQQGK